MWIIQGETLISIPDDAPMPPGSVAAEPPADFWSEPAAFRIEGTSIVRDKTPRAAAGPRLTREDVVKLKQALDQGEIG